MLKVEIPKDRNKLKQQIEALRYQILVDTNEEDKRIHAEALLALEEAMEGNG